MFRYYFIFLLIIPSLTVFSQTENDSLYTTEEIKVISFRNESDIFNSASDIHVLNSKSLGSLNGKNAGDVLSTVPGVFIKNYGNVSSLQTISLNGLGAEHTTILLNGFKLNSLQNGQIDLSLIPKESISRIEVLSNGYSSVYGSEAMSGIVNIITDDDSSKNQNDLSLTFSALYGSYNNKKFYLDSKKRMDKIKFGFLVSSDKSDNDFDYYFDNGTEKEKRKRQNSGYNIYNYTLDINAELTKKILFYLYSQYISSDKNVPGIETGNTSPITKQIDKNWNTIIGVNYKGRLIALENATNFQNNLMNYTTLPVINSFYKNIVISNSTKLTYIDRNLLSIFGFDILNGGLNSNQTEDNILRNQYSIYNSSTISFFRFFLYPSFRYDYISDIKKDVWTYKLGVNFKLLEEDDNIHFRGNIGRNFRAPTFNELYWKDGGNKNIEPESSDNFELGMIVSGLKIVRYTFDISYVYINAKNRILWKPGYDRMWRPVNILESESKIFNTSLKLNYRFKKKIGLSSELSYCHNISVKKNEDYPGDVTAYKQMIYIPAEQAKISFGADYNNISVNLFYSYIGIRYSDSENINQLNPASALDGNIKYDLSISDFNIGIKIDINNITNTDYQYISGYPLPLRNYLFSINIKYKK